MYIVYTAAAKKAKAVTLATTEPEENAGADCIASRTRQRRGFLDKAQISGPLELQDSPDLVGRGVFKVSREKWEGLSHVMKKNERGRVKGQKSSQCCHSLLVEDMALKQSNKCS